MTSTALDRLPELARRLLLRLAEAGRDSGGELRRFKASELRRTIGAADLDIRRALDQLEVCGLVDHSMPQTSSGIFKFDFVFLTVEGEALATGFDIDGFREQAAIAIHANAPMTGSPVNIGGSQVVHPPGPQRGHIVVREAPTAAYVVDRLALYVFARVENDGDARTWIGAPAVTIGGNVVHASPPPAPLPGFEPLAGSGYKFAGAAPFHIDGGSLAQLYWQIDVTNTALRDALKTAKVACTPVDIVVAFECAGREPLRFEIATDGGDR